jgi:hypothetical protein
MKNKNKLILGEAVVTFYYLYTQYKNKKKVAELKTGADAKSV